VFFYAVVMMGSIKRRVSVYCSFYLSAFCC
jgi:hypothetical protein